MKKLVKVVVASEEMLKHIVKISAVICINLRELSKFLSCFPLGLTKPCRLRMRAQQGPLLRHQDLREGQGRVDLRCRALRIAWNKLHLRQLALVRF